MNNLLRFEMVDTVVELRNRGMCVYLAIFVQKCSVNVLLLLLLLPVKDWARTEHCKSCSDVC